MDVNTLDAVIEMYTNHLLQGELEGFKIEISPEIKDELAAIALYLDSKTVRASGEIEAVSYTHLTLPTKRIV